MFIHPQILVELAEIRAREVRAGARRRTQMRIARAARRARSRAAR
jgi:hypothetical protein